MQQLRCEQLQSGYIALLTALVLSSALAASAAVLLLFLPLAQQAVQVVQQTERARLIVHGCARMVEQAVRGGGREMLAGTRIVFVGVGECAVITDEILGAGGRVVHVRSVVRDVVVDLRVVLDPVTKEIRAQSESP